MKFTISVPDDVFEAGEHRARQLGISRSQLYREALIQYLTTRGAKGVTAWLDWSYGRVPSDIDPALLRAQFDTLSDEPW